MAQNLFIQIDKNENMMPTKAKSTGRIDGIVATIMALGLMNVPAAPDIGRMLNKAILDRAGFA
jgi:phage terminase large subunit-like protein